MLTVSPRALIEALTKGWPATGRFARGPVCRTAIALWRRAWSCSIRRSCDPIFSVTPTSARYSGIWLALALSTNPPSGSAISFFASCGVRQSGCLKGGHVGTSPVV